MLNEPNIDHLCPVCTEPLIEPYLTDCDYHFCNTCRRRLLATERQSRMPRVSRTRRPRRRALKQAPSAPSEQSQGTLPAPRGRLPMDGRADVFTGTPDPVIRKCGFILLACPLLWGVICVKNLFKTCKCHPATCQYAYAIACGSIQCARTIIQCARTIIQYAHTVM